MSREIHNPVFRSYADIYRSIEDKYRDQIERLGLPFVAEAADLSFWQQNLARLESHGIRIENGDRSFCYNWLSPACQTCRKGLETTTGFISLRCSRSCYFCFNPNQEQYAYYCSHERDLPQELEEARRQGLKYKDIALTGGEPLLHKEKTLIFFATARRLYPKAYTRLYTSGDFLDEAFLAELCAVGLNEIRFSVKIDDSLEQRRVVLAKIALSKVYIPQVVVEMPVIPGSRTQMEELLLDLDKIGITGINLLEFCFPLHNAEEYRRRGHRLKFPPYRVLYDYSYGGGLPVAGSEEECCELLCFAAERGLKMGVHYCSLENKFTGQIYQLNKDAVKGNGLHVLSRRDCFLKSVKVFGEDIAPVKKYLQNQGLRDFQENGEYAFLEFPVRWLKRLRKRFPDLEVGISYVVREQREGGPVLREVKIEPTTPAEFDEEKL